MARSAALAAEVAAMDGFDVAMQKVAALPRRTQVRVLTHVADLIGEQLGDVRDNALSVGMADARDAAREARERLDQEDLESSLAPSS
jgi:hypothetical protein